MSEKTFEEKLNRLEEITKKLENGDCSLEDAMNLYDEGKELAASLNDTLKAAKQKIEVAKIDD